MRRLPPMIAPGSGTIIEVIGGARLYSGFDSGSGSSFCSDFDFRFSFSHLKNMLVMIGGAATLSNLRAEVFGPDSADSPTKGAPRPERTATAPDDRNPTRRGTCAVWVPPERHPGGYEGVAPKT